jgi:hypothetical protein
MICKMVIALSCIPYGDYLTKIWESKSHAYCPLGWVDIGTGTKVPLRFVTYLS